MKITLNWQKKAVIIFMGIILLLSVILIIFAIREAEREKLVRERDLEESQRRTAEIVIDQTRLLISEAEDRIFSQIANTSLQSKNSGFTNVCKKIAEDEVIVSTIFYKMENETLGFPLLKPLYHSTGEIKLKGLSPNISSLEAFQNAEDNELKAKNYAQAIGFSGNATKETPGWHEDMNPFMMFQLKLDSGEWRTWPLDVPWTRSEWRKDGKAVYYGVNGRESSPLKAGIVEKDLTTDSERYIYQMEGGAAGVFRTLRCSRDYTKLAFYQDWGNLVQIIDIQSGETLQKFPNVYGAAWSPDGNHIMTVRGFRAFHVFSLADGTKQEYDLSEFLPEGGFRFFDWSPDGSQVAFNFMFAKYSTHLIRDVIPAEK